ncbi:unnamed protein product [Durusdinium trenchii]|uniref:Uncharacterized protein n=1 Tax=Durusdinium trenchii TaxID=1381693 RepID=A0ABP0PF66_9DINO
MHIIRQQAAAAEQRGIFKSASASDVLLNLAWTRDGQEQAALYSSLPHVSSVDYFVSHSWSCPRWKKILAISHYFNLNLAICMWGFTCILMSFMLIAYAGGLSSVARECQPVLYGTLLHVPMAVFLITYLFGHLLSGRRFWFDCVCVNQSNALEKGAILQAIPAFVANSTHMLILWDERYFDRLWCNYELAVSALTSNSSGELREMHFVPTWAPLWTLSSVAATFVLAETYDGTKPMVDSHSRASLFVSWFNFEFAPLWTCFVVAIPTAWFCFGKIDGHKLMLDQMESFDFRNAQCTLETDRVVLQRQVLDLFEEDLDLSSVEERCIAETSEDSNEDLDRTTAVTPLTLGENEPTETSKSERSFLAQAMAMDNFNDCVRGPLRESVMSLMGQEGADMPFKLLVVFGLPIWGLGLIEVFGCDGNTDCRVSASSEGYASMARYFVGNAAINMLIPVLTALVFPLALRINFMVTKLVAKGPWRMVLGSIFTTGLFMIIDALQAAGPGAMVVILNRFSTTWLIGFLGACGLLCWLASLLFFRRVPDPVPAL